MVAGNGRNRTLSLRRSGQCSGALIILYSCPRWRRYAAARDGLRCTPSCARPFQILASASSRGVFSLLGQGGDLPVLHVPCRDGDGQTPASPWRKSAPSIAASPQRNLTPWPLSRRDDAVQQESSPGHAGHSSRGKIPKPLRYAAGC